ncbi:hypothetical protein GH741_02835 [Aquibacillus halophilus]|uniref:Uncharacterized protein n=1 Tax=Aquibacillus halophilus TaxID=930132 RepID=A0A6A8DFH3_9BACI|nr:hypothetical protein [Aquibacillus halophilus]MRH41607.1 hypothetical protein [Aquibacillus halophilus]
MKVILTRKTDNVFGAVWLATLVLTYKELVFRKNENIYFKQVDIQKLAQELCSKKVQSARISQWCNGDYHENNYNYLRALGSKRRLTTAGEFNGKKEYPDRLFEPGTVILEIGGNKITYGDLVEWYRGTYSKIDN